MRILLDLDLDETPIVTASGERIRQTDMKRFLKRLGSQKVCDRCWEFSGASVDGYVQVRVGASGTYCQAHRLSWMFHNRMSIPEGILVLHECDNRRCVNPKHLFLGTYKTNAEDREAKGRGNQPKGEDNGFSVLNNEQVSTIRRLYIKGKKGNTKMLKEMFGISQPTVYSVANYKSWRHV